MSEDAAEGFYRLVDAAYPSTSPASRSSGSCSRPGLAGVSVRVLLHGAVRE
ncbi:hypothetical protein [Streptomyces coelicoflavus]|uniref:hypothetical protein n=1 Tax=Streptomyces coelicoflavus TaxID=285562 RepID=UPI002E263D05